MGRQCRRLLFVVCAACVGFYFYDQRLPVKGLLLEDSSVGQISVDIQSDDVLVVLPIPRTGMMSLSSHLAYDVISEPACNCETGKTRCQCRNKDDNIWLFNSYHSTGHPCGTQADFTELTEHCPVDRWFMTSGEDKRRFRRYNMVTMLREPVSRYISEWLYLRNRNWTYVNEPRLWKKESPELQKKGLQCLLGKKMSMLSLTDFVNCQDNPANNRQTHMLANKTRLLMLDQNSKSYQISLQKAAQESLRKLPFFGILSALGNTAALLEKQFGIKLKRKLESRPSESDKVIRSLSPELLRQVAQVNALDMRLYRYAVQEFTKRYLHIIGGNVTLFKAPDDEEPLRENRDFDLMRIPAQDVLLPDEIRKDFIPDDDTWDANVNDEEDDDDVDDKGERDVVIETENGEESVEDEYMEDNDDEDTDEVDSYKENHDIENTDDEEDYQEIDDEGELEEEEEGEEREDEEDVKSISEDLENEEEEVDDEEENTKDNDDSHNEMSMNYEKDEEDSDDQDDEDDEENDKEARDNVKEEGDEENENDNNSEDNSEDEGNISEEVEDDESPDTEDVLLFLNRLAQVKSPGMVAKTGNVNGVSALNSEDNKVIIKPSTISAVQKTSMASSVQKSPPLKLLTKTSTQKPSPYLHAQSKDIETISASLSKQKLAVSSKITAKPGNIVNKVMTSSTNNPRTSPSTLGHSIVKRDTTNSVPSGNKKGRSEHQIQVTRMFE